MMCAAANNIRASENFEKFLLYYLVAHQFLEFCMVIICVASGFGDLG